MANNRFMANKKDMASNANIQAKRSIPPAGKRLHRKLILDYGTITAAAKHLGISANSVYYHIRRGSLPECLKHE